MKEFPNTLVPKNLENFNQYRNKRKKAYLRRYIYEFMLDPQFINNKTRSIDLLELQQSSKLDVTKEVLKQLLEEIGQELTEKGWCYEFGLHSTVLFIYPPNEKPKLLQYAFDEF